MRVAVLDKIVNDNVTQQVGEICLIGKMGRQFDGKPYQMFMQTGAKLVKVFLFSKLSNKTRQNYDTEIGQVHSKFRAGIMLTIFRGFKRNTFDIFLPSSVNKGRKS